jgi:hypothetical protein
MEGEDEEGEEGEEDEVMGGHQTFITMLSGEMNAMEEDMEEDMEKTP